MSTRKIPPALTRAEELRILDEQVQKMREDPQYGVQLAQKAGILDKNGNLTPYYRTPDEEKS